MFTRQHNLLHVHHLMTEQILFIIVLLTAGYFIRKRILQIVFNIRLGRPVEPKKDVALRWSNVFLVAFGQKKMVKRMVPAFFHFWIYVGFLIINIEVLEFVFDGVTGSHRSFAPYLGTFYPMAINVFEFFAVAVLISCFVFLARRNVVRIKRFWSPEMTSWPRWDANLILIIELLLVAAILTMNATDQVLQARHESNSFVGSFFLSSLLLPFFEPVSNAALAFIERFAWWFHSIGILGFALYITYSKHLHIVLAFFNTYRARLKPMGYIASMPAVTREVRSMLGQDTPDVGEQESGTFGAKDVADLNRDHILAAYACTECGRCTAECPAHHTGKKLSPRRIMMSVRDRVEDVGKALANGAPDIRDGKTLLGDYITKEEINACTGCNACVEACPILINPLDIIMELRRYVTMEESGAPAQWNAMFQNIETNFAPWKFPSSERFKWADDIKKSTP